MEPFGQNRGWKTIIGFVILGVGGVLLALSGTELAIVDKQTAGAIAAAGATIAGIGARDAVAKQTIELKKYASSVDGLNQLIQTLSRPRTQPPASQQQPTKRR